MDELRAKYQTQVQEYETLVKSAIDAEDVSQIPVLREKNLAITKTLNDLIEKLTFLKKETPNLAKERDDLLTKLKQIQTDYSGLKANTDKLETLRRIRQQESSEANRELYIYFGLFLVVCLLMVVYLAFIAHRNDMTAPRASIPPSTAALV